MPKIVVDPCILQLLYPSASTSHPQKIRLIAQVIRYDEDYGNLHVKRLPNVPPVYSHIDLESDHPCEDQEIATVNVSSINLQNHQIRKGAVVSIWAIFDGTKTKALDISGYNGHEVLNGGSDVLAAVSVLTDL